MMRKAIQGRAMTNLMTEAREKQENCSHEILEPRIPMTQTRPLTNFINCGELTFRESIFFIMVMATCSPIISVTDTSRARISNGKNKQNKTTMTANKKSEQYDCAPLFM